MRRHLASAVVGSVLAVLLTGCVAAPTSLPSPPPSAVGEGEFGGVDHVEVERALTELEREYDAVVSVVATDTKTGESIAHNPDRRMKYASTLKAFAAAQFLRTVSGSERNELARWTIADVTAAGYSPVTSEHIDDGLTYMQLAEAAVRYSDNTAFNLVLERIGGPIGLDAGLEDLGDATTNVVNAEPELNAIELDSIDDTTTAAAFTATLKKLLDGNSLSSEDTQLLIDWMSDNRTGDPLIRAGAPAGWVIADKSGGSGPIRNDIAVASRPGASTIIISILTTRNEPDVAYDDSLVASTAAVVLRAFDR